MKIAKQKLEDTVTLKNKAEVDLQDDVFIYGQSEPAFSEQGTYTQSDLAVIAEAGGYALIDFMQVSDSADWSFDFDGVNKAAIMKYNDVMQYTEAQAQLLDDLLTTGIALDDATYMMDSIQDAEADNGLVVIAPGDYYGVEEHHGIVLVEATVPDGY